MRRPIPRGFVKAELNRPNGVLLEVPGLLSTPALGRAVFDYQFEIQQARDAAAKSGAAASESRIAACGNRGATAQSFAQWHRDGYVAKGAGDAGRGKQQRQARRCRAEPKRCSPTQPRPPPQPLNIIQKTFRAEALARLQRGMIADCGFVERLVVFWSNHFCISANKGGLARMWAGSFEREAIRPMCSGASATC